MGMNMEDRIGDTAGKVWHLLNETGNVSVTNIVNDVDESPSLVYMAIGWLAREGKIEFLESGKRRGYRVILRN